MSVREFETEQHATLYSKYRPSYPIELVEKILSFLNEKNSHLDVAVDVACGNGQATLLFAPFFKEVYGFDISENQIKEAIKNTSETNVTFSSGPGEKIPLADNSVNLITVAQAVHWFNLDNFYAECKRTLQHNGVLAIFGYDIPSVYYKNSSSILNELPEVYKFLKPYFAKEITTLENNYQELQPTFEEVQRDFVFKHECKWKIEDLVNYAKTWSGYQNYNRINPDNDLMEKLKNDILKVLNNEGEGDSVELTVVFEIFLILCRKN